jgi:hypothetical protein
MVDTAYWNCSLSLNTEIQGEHFFRNDGIHLPSHGASYPRSFGLSIIDYTALKSRKLQNVISCLQIGWI